ncbi:hypothetical protein FISHEDRAFT_70358 [Fistulina hepatica ATCC 64428]|uniref:Uncharacterized protein n=1 Tax=Fistulina hepatica ATCC 64428 TaxID=1128425 RepID=A0A0D7AJ21_9AGAR|nr:hypothetical protein FISHEDRAFT_70358 [Fistulina hepatica ATCC 64428]
MQLAVDDSSASRKPSDKVPYDNMAENVTCRHCGHDVFPPLPNRSFDIQELKEFLRDGVLPSPLIMKCIEQEIANFKAAIKELEDTRAALVQSLNPVIEYLAVARSISSPIRSLPGELLCNILSYVIASRFFSLSELRDAMFEAGILSRRGSTIHRLARVCKYWWRVVRSTPMLYPVTYISYDVKGVLAVRRYIEMTSPHPLKFYLDFYCNPEMRSRTMEEINYSAVLQELINASSRWQTVDLTMPCMGAFSSGFETEVATCVYGSSYPALKDLRLHSFPMLQFFSQEQVPALRVLKISRCQIELHAVQPILLQITSLDLRCLADINVDLDFHAILSYAPALSQLRVDWHEPYLETYMSRVEHDAHSPVLLSHLRRLHIEGSTFMLNIITAPNLVHFRLKDRLLHSDVVDTFLRRSRCDIESLYLDIQIWSSSMAPSIAKLWCQMPHVTHLAVPASQEIWVPLQERTPDGRYSMFPQLQHLEIDNPEMIHPPRFQVVSDMIRVVLKRCGARKIRVEGRTGYRKGKKPPVLRRLDIDSSLTRLQHRQRGGRGYIDDDDDNSDGGEEDSSYGDDDPDDEKENTSGDDGVAYI